MQGETLTEIANALEIEKWTAEKRIRTAGIKALTREAVYPVGTIEAIRNTAPVGRPPKDKPAPANSRVKKSEKPKICLTGCKL